MFTTQEILAAKTAVATQMIKDNLNTSDEWVIRALKALFKKQTEDERNTGATLHHNGVGFSGFDAELLSSFAQRCLNFVPGRYSSPLSPKQMALARKKIVKYSGQLLRIAKAARQPEQREEFDEARAEMMASGIESFT